MIAGQFRAAGHSLVADAGEADLVIINTCSVTAQAESDSRQKIHRLARITDAKIVATGCWVTLNAGEVAGLPGVEWVVPNLQKDSLAAKVLDVPMESFDQEPVARQPLPGLRHRTRAFIKAQDGCDNHCTFCVTRLARGASRSRLREQVILDIHSAIKGGAKEIVLTGVQLGAWGRDLSGGESLTGLVSTILEQAAVPRLRLSSLEPWEINEDFLTLWQDARLCRHLHLPLQSGSASVLRRMARRTSPEEYARVVDLVRRAVPDMALTTDIIVGFPGETKAEFIESLDLLDQLKFAAGHVFTYSPRPGTPAASFPNQVPLNLRKARNAQMRAALARSAFFYRQRFLGKYLPVLWESVQGIGTDGWTLSGLTDNYIRVEAPSLKPLWNEISQVHLAEITKEGLRGEITL